MRDPTRFLIIERSKPGKVRSFYERLGEQGRMLPLGVTYLESWVSKDLTRSFQLMEAEHRTQIEEWIGHWDDLADFEVLSVNSSEEAASVVFVTRDAEPEDDRGVHPEADKMTHEERSEPESHRSMKELEQGLETIRASPMNEGTLHLIVCRPRMGARELLKEGELSVSEGLVGDNWKTRGSKQTLDRSAHPEMQLTLMNSRVIDLLSRSKQRWALAGDQLFIDLDLSQNNLPAGTRLALGSAVVEITGPPHTGCKKFAERFGVDAVKFVHSPEGKTLRLRGVNAKVVQPGTIRTGDSARKL